MMTEQAFTNTVRAQLAYDSHLRVLAIVDLACATATEELSGVEFDEPLDSFMDSIRALDGDTVPAYIHPTLLPVAKILNRPLAGAPEDLELEQVRMDENACALATAGLLGLAVKFAHPVRKYYSASSYTCDWGHWRTVWIYADTYEQAWQLGSAWAGANHDQARGEAIAKINPFFAGTHNRHPYFTQAAAERVQKVRDFNADQCRAALELPNMQKGVVTALNRRLGLLKRQGKA
jgi:hypothetical protein